MADDTVWKKPSEIMKIHRRKKSVSQRRITTDPAQRTKVIYKSPSKSQKRKNPFHKDSPHPNPSKRTHLDLKENRHDPVSCQLFSMLDSVDKTQETPAESKAHCQDISEKHHGKLVQPISEVASQQEITGTENKTTTENKKEVNQIKSYLPIDWALKTKLRIVSSRPLNWCVQLKSAEEAQGVTDFTQNAQLLVTDNTAEKKLFHRSCMYWVHPNIPWLRHFPRIIDDSRSSLVVSPLLQDDIQRGLQADWEQSFTSVYHMLRSGLCPYFYLCTHQFTVLFHAGTGASHSGIVAMVTPTTRGFRESLESEGITLKLPVGNYNKTQLSTESKTNSTTLASQEHAGETNHEGQESTKSKCTEEEEDDDLLATDDAASGWLESMGLDKKQFPSLDPNRVKLQRDSYRAIDHRPESLVLIEGADVQAFFNFLLNCRTCTAMAGQQAGLPPTILSPKPFKGGTLKSQKVRHTAVKQSDRDGVITHAHIVEVTGAILPCHYQHIVSLLHKTQCSDFGMVFNNHDPTVPFNVLPEVLKTQRSSNVSNKSQSGSSPGESSRGQYQPATGVTSPTGPRSSPALQYPHSRPLTDDVSTILDSITEEENHTGTCVADTCKGDNQGPFTKLCDRNVLNVGKHFQNVAISDRIHAIKEVICTPAGFTWNV